MKLKKLVKKKKEQIWFTWEKFTSQVGDTIKTQFTSIA